MNPAYFPQNYTVPYALRRIIRISLQRHYRDAGLALTVDPQAEVLDGPAPPQNGVDRLAQRAGALAVDDGNGLQMSHDRSREEILHHALRLQRLQAPDVQLPGRRGPQGTVGVLPDGDRRGLFLGRPLIVLNKPDFIRLGLES